MDEKTPPEKPPENGTKPTRAPSEGKIVTDPLAKAVQMVADIFETLEQHDRDSLLTICYGRYRSAPKGIDS